MKNNPLLSFFISLIITTVILGIIGLGFLFLTFNLAGGETLSQIENQNIGQLVISVLVLIVAVYAARHYIKSSRRYTAYGILILPLIIVLLATIYLLQQNFYHKEFDEALWKQSKWKPEQMTKTLVREKTLIGLTKTQIKELLGNGSEEYGNVNSDEGSIVYFVKNDWTLRVVFRKGKVVETELRLPYLSV